MTQAEKLAREICQVIFDTYECNCDEEAGEICIVDLCKQLMVELETTTNLILRKEKK